MKLIKLLTAAILVMGICGSVAQQADPAPSAQENSADKAWKELTESFKPPALPEELNVSSPTPQQREQINQFMARKAGEVADKAREFYTKYPADSRAAEAKDREKRMLQTAVIFGDETRRKQLEEGSTEEEKFQIKINDVHRRAMAKQPEGLPAVLREFEAGIRELLKEQPKSEQLWEQFLVVARNADRENAIRVLDEMLASENAPTAVKETAQELRKRLDAVGQPFEMSFTAMDGRQVDVQKMKGKVVLIDFWATWCGPCIAELPTVKKVYEKYHPKGFEIVGVSLDKNAKALEKFVRENEMPWPQYFDGKGWGAKFAMENNISSIPAMYLVDKKGLLRDMNAREDLAEKVAKMLAENE